MMRLGFVTLVGAGPGHLDFLTLAGYRSLQEADIILYDALLADEFLKVFPSSARTIYVGKRCGRHALDQQHINALIVAYARQGKTVVRLKGGDPFIFGRGAEEVRALREAGIDYRVIPGVSALNGVAASLSLPLTVRDGSNEFRAIQGHRLPDDEQWWQDLARYRGTLAIFMGLDKLHATLKRLAAAGAKADLPVAIIESDSEGRSQAFTTTVGHFLDFGYKREGLGPVIVYLGKNVLFMDQTEVVFHDANQETQYEYAATHLS